ncbi:MAG: FGGY family carbohydrate kinase, partial [Planctomycetota bacterium]
MAVLVIDQGGQSTRALVYHPDGSSGPLQRCPSPTGHHDDDRIEHDSETLLESVFSVVDDAQRSGNEPITAVGLATQRSSLLFWDAATGDALTPVVSWQDRRAAEELEALALDPVDVHARTGLRPTAHYGASKLRWFLDREPSWRPAAKRGEIHAGPLASWLALRLTESAGSGLADPANAQRTLLWNLRSCDWDPELLRRFDIPRALLPRCAPTTGPFGNVAAVGAPLALVTGDQSAVVFGDGDPNPNRIAVTLGTGAFLQRVTERPSDDAALLTSVVRVDSDRASYVREAVINGCASALERMISPNLRPPEHAPELERALSTVVDPPLFLNGVGGLGTPEWIADFESRWIGDGDGAER